MGIKHKQFDVRDEITKVIKQRKISESDFHEVPKNQWEKIIGDIEKAFIKGNPSGMHWYWEYFNGEVFYLQFTKDNAYQYLDRFVNDSEVIWFLIEKDRSSYKFWVYEGKINAITSVLGELGFYEYYIASKKLSWILCENHHNYLIGCGDEIIQRMKKSKSKIEREIQ